MLYPSKCGELNAAQIQKQSTNRVRPKMLLLFAQHDRFVWNK